MKTMRYENETFWQVTDESAVRPHKKDRIKILTFGSDGNVKCVSRTIKPSIRQVIVQQFVGVKV